jgi:alkanesulfonate monooxygenase SsuD/methylene tetrahydromethanopterin reductase-like flavin-dependent oxidoreductase (luciferase family)
MRQIGAFPRSQLKALEEVTIAIRELLAGERLTYDGEYVHLDDAELVHPPGQIPPISLGVRGPKSLALSGRLADGTILAEYSAPAYVSWAREEIESGIREAGHDREHRLTVLSLTCAGSTTSAARQRLRPLMASEIGAGDMDAQLAPTGILPKVRELMKYGDRERFSAEIPDGWIDQLAIAGTPEDWKLAISRLIEAGANSVVLTPLPGTGPEELDVFLQHLAS